MPGRPAGSAGTAVEVSHLRGALIDARIDLHDPTANLDLFTALKAHPGFGNVRLIEVHYTGNREEVIAR